MKVILVREKASKIVEQTFLVNDDVVVSDEIKAKLEEAGYEHLVYHPHYVKSLGELTKEMEYLAETL